MSADIEFGELPPSGKGQGAGRPDEFIPVLAVLKSRPGEWAKVKTYKGKNSAAPRAQVLKKRHGVEAVSRGGDVWARWPEGKDA